MPAPVSSSFSAASNTVTPRPRRASASAAVSPPMPAPAIRTLSEVMLASDSAILGRLQVGEGAFRRAGRMGREGRIVAIEGRAIRADDLGVAADVAENVGVVERRQR